MTLTPTPRSSLEGIRILAGLPDTALRNVSAECLWQKFDPGEQVFSQASRDQRVYLVVTGRVRVALYSAGGREVTFTEVGAGDCFGELSAVDGGPRSASVEALDETLIAVMPTDAFWSLLERHPVVMRRVMALLAAMVRSLSERVFDLSTLGIQHRVHVEILRLAKGVLAPDGSARIAPPPRHVDIANRVATNREQVTHALSHMARQGIVIKSRGALTVPDVARLERIVAEVRRRS